MSDSINYKAKYEKLKLQFVNSMDMAFRLGYEEGQKDAQLESMQQQLMAQQQAAMNGQPVEEGAPVDENGQPMEEQAPEQMQEHPDGSELDQHIAELESMVNKSDLSADDLKKALDGIRSFQAKTKQAQELKKSDAAVKSIAKSLKRPSVIGKQASTQVTETAKKALSMQEKIVGDIMKSWESEEKKTAKDIHSILAAEGLSKKE